MSTKCELGGARLTVPAGWHDTTDDVDVDDRPYTLTHEDGVGALQFTVGLYRGGTVPKLSSPDLLDMVEGFGQKQGFEGPFDQATEDGDLALAAASYRSSGDFIRVWYVSDSRNVAAITYVCVDGAEGRELGESEQIVRSICFEDASVDP